MSHEPPSNAAAPASIRRILIATDFSEGAATAQRFGLELAAQLGAEVTITHVHDAASFALTEAVTVNHDALCEAASVGLGVALRRARAVCPAASGMLVDGEASEGILEAAVRSKADLVVVGTHGRSGLARLLLGSVAEKVLRRAEVPVLTVSARTHPTL